MNLSSTMTRRQAAGAIFGTMLAAAAVPALAQSAMAPSVPMTGDDAIAILENDHERIHAMLDRLIDHVDSRHATLMELGMLVTVHNATEENFIYPAVGMVAGRKADQSLLFHQQDEAKVVVWSLNELLRLHPSKTAEFTMKARALRTAVLEHVAQEQNVDFPALRTALGAEGLDYVTKQVRTFRQHFA